ncbi:MAG: hypothetical protein JNM24_20005 [Bdellovibrionaceae bacterium]|nr:hypothetical protein [Pseudobdellovibrionaceae bacterium]
MSQYFARTFLVLFVVLMMVACGQPGELGLESAPVGLLSTGEAIPVPEPIIEKHIKTCKELLSSNQYRLKSQTIRFEDTKVESRRNQVCEFSTDENNAYKGNLTTKNEYLRARNTQDRVIELPAGAVICDMEIESAEQDFNYDDVFFLSLNNYVLASNHKSELTKVLSQEVVRHTSSGQNVSLYAYDWLKVRDTFFENIENDFCVGADQNLSSCQWPVSEQFGKIKLKFDPEILVRLSEKKQNAKQALSFVITGDDNIDSDCYHQRLDLGLEIKYYIPEN